MNTERVSAASELLGRTIYTDLKVNKSNNDNGGDQPGFLGRTGAHWDFRTKIKAQSVYEKCDHEVMTENTGVQEVTQEHPLREPDYGEPFKTQCLRIDFTPIPGLDDDPDRLDKDPIEQGPSDQSISSVTTEVPEPEVGGTQWLQKPATSLKLQSMAKLPEPKHCPYAVATEDYANNDENFKFGETIEKLSPITKPSGSDIKSCYYKKNTDTYKLFQVMDDFDRKHPKSMEPPGHPPPLNYAILQRVHSTVALPSDKPRKVIACECPKLPFKT